MNIGVMSMVMHKASLENAVSMSVLKLAMNNTNETATQMNECISNMAIDTSKGTNIDIRA